MPSEMEELLSEIEQTDFHKVKGEEWNTVFDKISLLLGADDAEIVDAALEQATIAIRIENDRPAGGPNSEQDTARLRLTAILAQLEQRADVVDRVTGFARRVASMARVASRFGEDISWPGFLEWVDSFQPPPDAKSEWDDEALIIRMELGAFGDDRETASSLLTGLLDHASLKVRACAAAALGHLTTGKAIGHATLGEILQNIHDREIERPGLAGPFYGVMCDHLEELPGNGRAAIKAWMLSILENRKLPEPPLPWFHFIGIDFHAHELFADDPEGVRELMRIGRTDIAALAASDKNEVIEDMEDVLVKLGNSDDAEVCRLASWHLAYNYRILHPRGRERGFVSGMRLSGGEYLFLNGYPDSPRYPYAAVLYPLAGRSFTTDEARQWIARLLPEELRGEATSFFPGCWPGPTLGDGQISHNKVHFSWTCGAVGNLKGDVSAQEWGRLTIIWHGDEEIWMPGEYVDGDEAPY